MRIKLVEIDNTVFSNREDYKESSVDELVASFKSDGQWNPILIIPNKNEETSYILVSGHYRYLAAKKLGWEEIEANIKNIDKTTALLLATKMNLKRQDMTPLEIGEQIVKLTSNPYNLTQQEIATQWGKTQQWVSIKFMLAASLSETIIKAISKDELNIACASVFLKFGKDYNKQDSFYTFIVDNIPKKKARTVDKLKELYTKFTNTTIYTIGYSNKSVNDLIRILQTNKIKIVLDIRKSVESKMKPKFNGEILEGVLASSGIGYIHDPNLGVIYDIQEVYKSGNFAHECFKQFYDFSINKYLKERKERLDEFVGNINSWGPTALLCVEESESPNTIQKHYCHRKYLADRFLDTKYFTDVIHL